MVKIVWSSLAGLWVSLNRLRWGQTRTFSLGAQCAGRREAVKGREFRPPVYWRRLGDCPGGQPFNPGRACIRSIVFCGQDPARGGSMPCS